jgi:hypothetical protein
MRLLPLSLAEEPVTDRTNLGQPSISENVSDSVVRQRIRQEGHDQGCGDRSYWKKLDGCSDRCHQMAIQKVRGFDRRNAIDNEEQHICQLANLRCIGNTRTGCWQGDHSSHRYPHETVRGRPARDGELAPALLQQRLVTDLDSVRQSGMPPVVKDGREQQAAILERWPSYEIRRV